MYVAGPPKIQGNNYSGSIVPVHVLLFHVTLKLP